MENRSGSPREIVRTKTAGRWEGDTLRLEQELVLGDGKSQHRSWRIRKLDAHRYEATANDVVGRVEGEAYGNVFHWSFTLALCPGHPLADVQMSQWMYLQPDGNTMMNHSTIRKFGDRHRTGHGAVPERVGLFQQSRVDADCAPAAPGSTRPPRLARGVSRTSH